MDSQTLLIAVLGCGSLFSLWFYGRAFGEYAKGGGRNVEVSDYNEADAVLAALLAALFLLLAYYGFHHTKSEIRLNNVIESSALYGGIVLFLLGLLAHQNKDILSLYGLKNFNAQKSFVWFLAFLPLLYFLQETTRYFTRDQGPQSLVSFVAQHHDPLSIAVVGFSICVVAPIAEEFLFRGFLYGVFSHYIGRVASIVILSLLFAAIHTHLPSFPALFIMSVCLTLAYERTGSLWTPIFMHACFNGLSFCFILWFPALER